MGWGVRVSHDVGPLVDKLKEAPSEVFQDVYCGYLLFLVGSADIEITEWLRKSISTLDSLTGEQVVFAVFARARIDLTLEAGISPWTPQRKPKNIGSVSLSEVEDSWALSRLVKSGRFGFVRDGDEITAITYAVDDIARSFGVLGDLPCLVVLDAIPKEKFQVIPLSPSTIDQLVPTLRRSIGKLLSNDQGKGVIERTHKILDLDLQLRKQWEIVSTVEQELDSLAGILKECEFYCSRDFPESRRCHYKSVMETVTRAVRTCNSKHFKLALKHMRWLSAEDRKTRVKSAKPLLRQMAWLTSNLHDLLKFRDSFDWPLDDQACQEYQKVCNHIRSKFPQLDPDIACDDLNRCDSYLNALRKNIDELVDKIVEGLTGSEADVEAAFEADVYEAELRKSSTLKEVALAKEMLATAKGDLDTLENSLAREWKSYKKEVQSFGTLVDDAAREQGLHVVDRKVANAARGFAGSIFTPDFLLKLWTALA